MGEQAKHRILYVDDEMDNLIVFRSAFKRDYEIITANSGYEAQNLFQQHAIDLVITDQRMPGMTGIELLKDLPDEPDSIRMVLTGFSDVEAIIEAINIGKVYKYITKPWDKNELKLTIDKALETLELRKENRSLIHELLEANELLEKKVIERTREIQKQKEEIEKQKQIIETEKDKADNLLLNILPDEIAEELKLTGKARAQKYEEVTVLFSDFKDFTTISENCNAEVLVSELDHCFKAFDDIIEKFGLEKIKTIGDAYMCAGGLPVPDRFNAHKMTLAAIEMQKFLKNFNQENTGNLLSELRIGIHTGPVIAGVVGKRKFAYDIWGDTVNIASRMESCGEAGKINISDATYQIIKAEFDCTSRGKIAAKGKGEMDMYFVDGEKPHK
ncbi:MAG: adenylate/guanylate cyclase domain-containing protein [Bacteroidota bacterium]|nr:adenylate/guanylate cyclase domain-containing protein [Bacteroidota bacterium]